MTDRHVNLQNARAGLYADVIANIAEKKICPFCPEHITTIHKNPIEEHSAWLVTDNMYPYRPTKQHVLIVHRQHIEGMDQVSSDAWAELRVIIKAETAKRGIVGGSFFLRFGETKFTGASVTHLHAHLIQSDPDDPTYDSAKGLMTRIG